MGRVRCAAAAATVACALMVLLGSSSASVQLCAQCGAPQYWRGPDQCWRVCQPVCPFARSDSCDDGTGADLAIQQAEREACNWFRMHHRASVPRQAAFASTHDYHDLPKCGRKVYLRGILRFYPGGREWERTACFQKLESYPKDIRDRLESAFFDVYHSRVYMAGWQFGQHGWFGPGEPGHRSRLSPRSSPAQR